MYARAQPGVQGLLIRQPNGQFLEKPIDVASLARASQGMDVEATATRKRTEKSIGKGRKKGKSANGREKEVLMRMTDEITRRFTDWH